MALVDPSPLSPWRNNYGVWVDEFQALGHGDCFTQAWPAARVRLTSPEPGLLLDRPYAQVDRGKLKDKLLRAAVAAGAEFLGNAKVEGERADAQQPQLSAVTVSVRGEAAGGRTLFARALLDASGHARRLVKFDAEFTPGYQAAYGILCEVVAHPFPLDEMLFMDWRDEHLSGADAVRNEALPTFLYVMPFSPTRLFLEETSLVARPGVDFDDIKLRLRARLAGLGVTVVKVLEEEHCLIPMGGVLPQLPQRVLGVGGTAGMVHPSTGFMLSKTIASSALLADALHSGLSAGLAGDALSAAVWSRLWPEEQRRMRTFMCFGMETLMQLDLEGIRRFFGTFFALPRELWAGFLSWRVRPVGLIGLGISLFAGFSVQMRLQFVAAALPFIPSFLKNFLAPQAGNRFTSAPWGGLALPVLRRPDAPPEAQAALVAALDGRLQILPPNPAAFPVLASGADFPALVGLPPALAGGLAAEEALGAAEPPCDYGALLPAGSSLTVPVDVSSSASSRDDRAWTAWQQRKNMPDQPALASLLPPLSDGGEWTPAASAAPPPRPATLHDVAVIGAGPAGLALAAELASRGLSVCLLAPEASFVNTYGVWTDEFDKLGLRHCLANDYTDALYWVDENSPNEGVQIGRGYGRVDRSKLRAELVSRAAAAGVTYLPTLVSSIDHAAAEGEASLLCEADDGGRRCVRARLAVAAAGHNRDLLSYESGVPPGWQTAYGVEVRLPAHAFQLDKAVFMDFRQADPEPPTSAASPWRVPSFLYVLPTDKDTVFIQETCLVSRVQVPFEELRRRLLRRAQKMGLPLTPSLILEEEASWIPLGGGLPLPGQRTVAFGAAAGLVHPASGFSVTNTLSKAAPVAAAIAGALKADAGPGGAAAAAEAAYAELWGVERKRRSGFNQFGMELLLSLRLADLRGFFATFYRLPRQLSQGFLSHRLSSAGLAAFAFAFFVTGDSRLKFLLITHLLSPAGSGKRLVGAYLADETVAMSSAEAAAAATAVVDRAQPPQPTAASVSAAEQAANEAAGIAAGFAGSRWWVVGSGEQAR